MKTSWKMGNCYAEDFFKTSWRRLGKREMFAGMHVHLRQVTRRLSFFAKDFSFTRGLGANNSKHLLQGSFLQKWIIRKVNNHNIKNKISSVQHSCHEIWTYKLINLSLSLRVFNKIILRSWSSFILLKSYKAQNP